MHNFNEQVPAKVLGQVVAVTKESGTMAYVATIRAHDNNDYIIVTSGHCQGGISLLHAVGCEESSCACLDINMC